MKSKIFSLISLLYLLTGCIHFFGEPSSTQSCCPPVSVEPVSDVVLRFATDLKYNFEMELVDSKIFFDDTLKCLRLEFDTQKILELCEARMFLVDITEDLLSRLNASGAARDQMMKRHFDYFDLEIYIHCTTYFAVYVDPAYISFITLRDGISSFYSGDTFLIRLDKWHARSEAYYKSRMFATIMRDAEKTYEDTHPVPEGERPYFGRALASPVDVLL